MDYEITYNTQSIIPIDDFTTKVIDDGNLSRVVID